MKLYSFTREQILKVAYQCYSFSDLKNSSLSIDIRNRDKKRFNDFYHIDIESILKTNNEIRNLENRLKYLKEEFVCDKCGCVFRNGDRRLTESNRGKTSGKHFCSDICSKRYSSEFAHTEEIKNRISKKLKSKTHKIKCYGCGREIEVHINRLKGLCDECQREQNRECQNKYRISHEISHPRKICSVCGQEKCKHPEICKHRQIIPRMIKYLGLDKDAIGTERIYEEFERIGKWLYDMYWVKKMSIREIKEICGYESSEGNFWKLLRYFLKDFRSSRDSVCNAIRKGISTLPKSLSSKVFKQGYHTTWENKRVFYRSSYELDYCNILDQERIRYEMESLRIEYYDSQRKTNRISVPDFLLVDSKTIVEVKSKFTYNRQNMIDKVEAYLRNGYGFKLIYEHQEFDQESFKSLKNSKTNTYDIEFSLSK